MIHGKNVAELIDPNLKGKFSADEATIVFKLAFKCLQYEDRESRNTKHIVRTLETLQTKTDVIYCCDSSFILDILFCIYVKTDILACRLHLTQCLKWHIIESYLRINFRH